MKHYIITHNISQQTQQFLTSQTGQIVLGLILGDATITPHRFEHSQQGLYWEYSKYISQQFQNEYPQLLTPKMKNEFFYTRKRTNLESPRTYVSQTFYTKRHDIFRELRQIFYPNETKIIPMEVIELYFTDLSLLFLYLDDGKVGKQSSHGLALALCNFPELQLMRFKAFLIHKFQVHITIQKDKQYQLLYFSMESSKKLLNQFNEMTQITNSIGLIGQTKLKLKKLSPQNPPVNIETKINYKLINSTLTNDSLIGVLQGFITGGANLRLNKDLQTGYLRLRLKNDSEFTSWVLKILDTHNYPYKTNRTKTSVEVGIQISSGLIQLATEDISILSDLIFRNPWFLKTLFNYKGRDLASQRGGLTIGLNHLPVKNVVHFSTKLNNIYTFNTTVRYRDKKTKASIYIPISNKQAFYQLLSSTNDLEP